MSDFEAMEERAKAGIRVPVRTTKEVKEEHLRGLIGDVLLGHEYTDGVSSFIVQVPGHEHLLQCGRFEIQFLGKDDPDYPKDRS